MTPVSVEVECPAAEVFATPPTPRKFHGWQQRV
jgi:hypothetical protein